jgi:hypothetical protein
MQLRPDSDDWEPCMRKAEVAVAWVVYAVNGAGGAAGPRGVCEQAEWDAMERDSPGSRTLVRAGITNEGEAERLARGTAGDAYRGGRRR